MGHIALFLHTYFLTLLSLSLPLFFIYLLFHPSYSTLRRPGSTECHHGCHFGSIESWNLVTLRPFSGGWKKMAGKFEIGISLGDIYCIVVYQINPR